jgi:hypothetical protein
MDEGNAQEGDAEVVDVTDVADVCYDSEDSEVALERICDWSQLGLGKQVTICSDGVSVSGKRMADTASALVIDVHHMHDPESRRFGRHLGLHPAIYGPIDCILRKPDCQHLAEVKKYLQEQLKPMVIFQCRQGKHRSLACAELVGDLARQSGFTVDVVHLARDDTWSVWQWACFKGQCEECVRPGNPKASQELCRVWHGL